MAKQLYSIDEDKMVDVEEAPSLEKEVDTPGETEEDEDGDEEEEKDDSKSEEDNDGDKEDAEDESDNENTDAEEEEDNDSDEEESEEDDKPVDVNAFIEEQFSEKYDIKTIDQFEEILDRSVELLDENEKLTAKVAELEKSEPIFKSENQKAVFNLLKDFDPDKLPDGLHMVAGLINMDPDKTDAKLVLEQEFIMQHPELTLDQARKKFQRRYESKYVIKEEDFDSLDAYNDKKDDLETDLKIEKSKAVKFIKEKQAEFKSKSEDKPEPKEELSKDVVSGIASHTKAFDEHLTGLETLHFETEEGVKFTYKFTKQQLNLIKSVAMTHLKNPKMYNEKGKLTDGQDPEGTFQQAAFALFGPNLLEEALKSAVKTAQILKADDIAKKKPKRQAKTSGELQNMSFDAQAERLAKKKQAEREKARG
jgi:hypothetical protein